MPEPDTNAIAIAPEQAVAPTSASPLSAILSQPERLENLAIETLERLYELHERDQKRAAEREYTAALSRVQASLDPVIRRGGNDHTGSRYAFLDDVIAEAYPRLTAEGFAVSFSTVEPWTEGMIRHRMALRHSGGHSQEFFLELPPDGAGARGGRSSMNALQARGSSATYAQRYLLCPVLGVQTTNDNDGNTVIKAITEDQAADLTMLLSEVTPETRQRFYAAYGIEKTAELPATAYKAAMAGLEQRRSQGR